MNGGSNKNEEGFHGSPSNDKPAVTDALIKAGVIHIIDLTGQLEEMQDSAIIGDRKKRTPYSRIEAQVYYKLPLNMYPQSKSGQTIRYSRED